MKKFAHSNGELNTTLHTIAVEWLSAQGHSIRQVTVDHGYDIGQEVENYLWMDVVIYQMPGWWMGPPWILKKYMDEVFTAGHGRLYSSDGRTRSDPSKKYGSGGMIQGRKYMISATWNAPFEAFDDPKQFFIGRGVDAVYFPFHKANQFLGMEALPTFLCVDVMKEPNVPHNIERYKKHLAQLTL